VPKLALHLALDGPITDIADRARRAEQAGADAVYVIEGVRDPFVPLAAVAAATERVEIGTYVANAYARTPQAAATAALAIDELSGGRLMFGIGAGNRHINEWLFGLAMDRPLGKMHDYLAVLRAFLQGDTGEGREVGGPVHHVETRFVGRPARRIPIVVAAAGPKMTELAAAKSDGVGLGVLIGPEHLAEVVRPRALAACEAAGRDPAQLRFPMAALTSIDDDEAAARHRARRAIVGLFHPIPHPYYDYLLREQGYARVADAATELAPQKRWSEATATIDDELLDRLTFTGTPAQCAARIADYDGLADEIIFLPLGTGERSPGPPAGDAGLATMFALARPTGSPHAR
jgi:alkanesulfonate monooxygenase SsuD/methylene tetrahydromethanopterin reductase-like flavin-dependent oxidoreductase (luciferase family)